MAIVRIPDEDRTLREASEITAYLASIGIDYERWKPAHPAAADADPEQILATYATELEELKRSSGYVTADVIDVNPRTPNFDTLLARVDREDWQYEDEVRFII